MKIEDLSLFLTKVSLFKGLNPDKIAKCLTEADFKIKEYKKNEIVFFDKIDHTVNDCMVNKK